MKIKVKLNLIVFVVMALSIFLISLNLLQQSRKLAHNLTEQSINNLSDQQTAYWSNRSENFVTAITALASIMEDY